MAVLVKAPSFLPVASSSLSPVEHPYSWMDESMKVLPQRERTKYPNIYG